MKKNGAVLLAFLLIFFGSLAIVIVARGKVRQLKSVLEGRT